jgi:acyl-coenzyme A thioesterase PaaI-like protein
MQVDCVSDLNFIRGFSYLQPAVLGEKIQVQAECLKIGKNIVFAEATFRNAAGKIVAKGKHTLALLNHHKTEGGFVRQ